MSFRGVNQSALDLVRDLKDDLDTFKKQVASVKQNTIRLGDWVLEAVDDSLVKMTNLVTGEESFIGGVGDGTTINQTITPEFPPFVIGGVVRSAFNVAIKTNVYVVPHDISISTIVATLASVGEPSDSLVFEIIHNGTTAFTSPALSTNKETYVFVHDFFADDEVYMMTEGGNSPIGLTVMLRI